ncbi:hypothetical protein Fcan01_16031 [Folsomia candida]|uniref:Uncharacterized protein n=1 Tax=Folsomia candida TaxID=158441 RepID=A0A226DW96_FOLCA|nr:hypothetical protein Fcan01_16031 [Folsomia candida]
MLTATGVSAVCHFLDVGSALKLFPFDWDVKQQCFKRAGRRHRFYFKLHKLINLFMNVLAAGRLMQATRRAYFPLVLRILNTVWLMAYTLTTLCFVQFETKEGEILQFVNCLLRYVRRTSIRKNYSEKPVSKKSTTELYEQKKLSNFIFFGMLMLVGKPFVHILLVDESPYAPHFVSSFFLPCEGFKNSYFPFWHKVPFMAAEYYLTTVFFFSWSLNWTIIFLGMSWIVTELKTTVQQYRSIECIATLMNKAFFLYLSTFPTLLFAIVSILMFGVIRIWHYAPGSNLMFAVCGIRCSFEAVTPLAVAGEVNDKNKEVVQTWGQRIVATKRMVKKEAIAYQKSFHAVRCTAGSLYTFENSIVLCCLNNCIQLTLDLFLTFK